MRIIHHGIAVHGKTTLLLTLAWHATACVYVVITIRDPHTHTHTHTHTPIQIVRIIQHGVAVHGKTTLLLALAWHTTAGVDVVITILSEKDCY